MVKHFEGAVETRAKISALRQAKLTFAETSKQLGLANPYTAEVWTTPSVTQVLSSRKNDVDVPRKQRNQTNVFLERPRKTLLEPVNSRQRWLSALSGNHSIFHKTMASAQSLEWTQLRVCRPRLKNGFLTEAGIIVGNIIVVWEFQNIIPILFLNLYQSIPSRVEQCLRNKGYSAKY